MDDMAPANAKPCDASAVVAERQARIAADKARHAARSASASKSKEDILRAGDLSRSAAALYQKAADTWTKRGPERLPFAEHCAKMAKRLSASLFARASLVATYENV